MKAIRSQKRFENKKGNGYDWAKAERSAWGWEQDNTARTGLNDELHLRLINAMVDYFQNILDTYPGGEGPP